jgi:crotonobetainyl-CoA:carnitine CoA-transferase CaiB-like acyl-CoA transferase
MVLANEMIFPLTVGEDKIRVVSGPATFDGRAAPINPKGSPGMGEHTEELLREAGYSADAIAGMKSRNIVQ